MKKTFKTLLRIFCFILAVVYLLLMFIGCGKSGEGQREGKLKVVATIFPAYDFCREIAADKAEIIMLLSPGQEAHSFDPTPGDIKAMQSCDVFVLNGGEGESWADKLTGELKCKIVKMTECAENVANGEGEADEHIWLDPLKVCKIAEAINKAFCEADPENAEVYEENTKKFTDRLTELDLQFQKVVGEGKKDTLVFADRFPAAYFADRYGLNYLAAFPGCEASSEASPRVMAELIERVQRDKISCVFIIELSAGAIAEAVREQTGAKILTFESCQSLTLKDFENGESYLSLMERNLETVKEALE